jgi:glycosyltransferase involved in cell wall biosynthesis
MPPAGGDRTVAFMRASVVIPTHNREKILRRVLLFYSGQVSEKEGFELVVVDDGSEDDTHRIFEGMPEMEPGGKGPMAGEYRESILTARKGWYRPGGTDSGEVYVRYIKIRKSGRSRARNVGIAFAAYPLIIFADDDIFAEPAFVRKHCAVHGEDDLLVVMGRVIHTGSLEDPFSATWKLKDINTSFLATGNASVLKKYLIEAGLFDEWYTVYGWEDFDLGVHLQQMGLRSEKHRIHGYHYDPTQSSASDRAAQDPVGIYNKERERGISAVYFFKNHPLPWVRRFTLVKNRWLRGLVRLLGRGNWFLRRRSIPKPAGLFRLIIRYKGYFDGVDDGKRDLEAEVPGV